MPKGSVLSEADKAALRIKLIAICEACWTDAGYKRTSIKSLCDQASISIGTFYAIFPTKEALFYQTLDTIQRRLEASFEKRLDEQPNKQGFARAFKQLLREYLSNELLCSTTTTDFAALLDKLPSGYREALATVNQQFYLRILDHKGLVLKVDKDLAFGVLSSLLALVQTKDVARTNYSLVDVLDFMVVHVIESIFA